MDVDEMGDLRGRMYVGKQDLFKLRGIETEFGQNEKA